MPKILRDIDKTIRNCAMELFIKYSYNNVDMRMISQKSGVAVGTLYNYYKSKKQLYLDILGESWQNTFNKLDSINGLNVSPEEKLRKFICTLYDDIETRNGLGRILINLSADDFNDDKEIQDLKNSLLLKTKAFFHNFEKVETLKSCVDLDAKLAETLIVSTLAMLESYPDNKNDNIDYLIKYFSLPLI